MYACDLLLLLAPLLLLLLLLLLLRYSRCHRFLRFVAAGRIVNR